MSYSTIPSRWLNWFDDTIHNTAWQQTKFLNWFMRFPGTRQMNGPISGPGNKIDGGLIRSVEEGLEKVISFHWEKMAPGQVAASLQEAPIQRPKISEKTVTLMYLVTRINISQNQFDAWRHNKYIAAGDLIPQAIRQAMLPLTNQVDQVICYGDNMLTPLTFDRIAGKGVEKFTGLFNGFQTFRGGLGSDDDLGDKGDYISTYIRGRTNLRQQGFDTGPYYILSDETTQTNSEQGNLIYTSGTRPITEYSSLMAEYKYKQGQLADWIESINAFPGDDTDESRFCLTQPYISQQGKKMEPAYVLYIGYNFKVWPLFAGGLNDNMEYSFVIGTSLAFQELNSYALYRTQNDLTFTGS